MKPLKYYLDTSVFNFIYAENDPAKKQATLSFFEEIKNNKLEIYISEVVTAEINEAPEHIKIRLLESLRKTEPILLSISPEIRSLSQKYVAEGIIPKKYEDDALHIAAAVVSNLDVIISWNFKHIVKLKTRLEVNGINKLLGYKEIEICSPEEVI